MNKNYSFKKITKPIYICLCLLFLLFPVISFAADSLCATVKIEIAQEPPGGTGYAPCSALQG
ncbi:MAG: hypothetical protein HZA78_02415 [Candidatus Schekmanbacteria bacterium]|nr:hypothetical protein [Candidatus Schekmanbacteria bacterium]